MTPLFLIMGEESVNRSLHSPLTEPITNQSPVDGSLVTA